MIVMSREDVRTTAWASVPTLALVALCWWLDWVEPLPGLLIALGTIGGIAYAMYRRAEREERSLFKLVREAREADARTAKRDQKLAVSERIIDSLPDPLFFLNLEGRVIRANPAANALTDRPLTGRLFSDGLRHPELLAAIDRAQETHAAQTVEITLPVPVECAYLARIEPVDPKAGAEDPALLIALHDVTAVLRTEQMRVDFVANVSHELRTPLTSLVGFIETLRGPARDDEEARDKFLGIMQDQSDRMLRLLQDLLSLSRIEMDEHTRPKGRIDVAHIIGSVTDMLAFKARSRGMRFELDLAPTLPRVQGDEDQLTQVFQNLIENAIKYGDKDTSVRISAEKRGDGRLAVSVTDHGRGIPKTHLPRLTERFYRVDAARSREMGGTGLGLAIVKHIVNRHRGRLVIDSVEGQGSTFTVILPIAGETAEQPAAASKAATGS